MGIERMDHVGVVVDDLASAKAFFVGLGLDVLSEMSLEDSVVDRIVGLDGVQTDVAMMGTPDGNGRLELIEFRAPPGPDGEPNAPANALGLRHLAFAVDDIEAAVASARACGGELVGALESYGNSYRLCYVRGPAGIIVELAEKIG
jgi:catechol 2,3-dioxygenase-like lactoylglutathione lyase family enzyme